MYLDIHHATRENDCRVNTQTDVIEKDESRERWKIARDLYASWIAKCDPDDPLFHQDHCEIKLIRQRQYKTQVDVSKSHFGRELVWKSTIGELKTLKDETKEEAKVRIDRAIGMISEATDYDRFIYKSPAGCPLTTMELSFSRVKGKYIPRFGQLFGAQVQWIKINFSA